ncbi:hypothetical protein SAMN06295900_103264 [Trinickia caryophylli]|uniref:Uncharacterized protein n=1 Tax=Trinickia caryophylli TaxID=28094 RepID=A0A1X7DI80_TRICW|nr:hypothetical protein SAMN06295900_103264 [Trinickia caryophylli]
MKGSNPAGGPVRLESESGDKAQCRAIDSRSQMVQTIVREPMYQ